MELHFEELRRARCEVELGARTALVTSDAERLRHDQLVAIGRQRECIGRAHEAHGTPLSVRRLHRADPVYRHRSGVGAAVQGRLDQDEGVARIPIERAIQLIAAKKTDANEDGANAEMEPAPSEVNNRAEQSEQRPPDEE